MRKTRFNWLCCCMAGAVFGVIDGAHAQSGKKAPQSVSPATPKKEMAPAKEPAGPAAEKAVEPKVSSIPHRDSFDLTIVQEERFKKLLPKTLGKLMNREPFHVVALGDSVMETAPRKGEDDPMKSYAAVFVKELAAQFYYTGGVRLIRPVPAAKSGEKPAIPRLGPEITLRSLGRGGKMMIHAMQGLTTYGFEHQPDLVLVGFGIHDALAGLNPASYARALQEVIETVRSRGAELVLLGPSLTSNDPAEESLGLTRAYLDTMREIAAESGILFVDLGDLTSLVTVGESVKEPEAVFDQIVRQYRRFFPPGDGEDLMHPSEEMHSILGKRIFTELTRGSIPSAWQVSSGTATLEPGGKFTLRYDLKNPSDKEAIFSVLPLVVRDWKPMDASPQVTLKPGESRTMQVSYARRTGTRGGIPSHEPTLRLPVLISGAGMTRIEDVRAEIRPFTLLWKLDAMFNQEKSFTLDTLVCNATTGSLKGTWTAEWLGQKRNGDFDAAAGEKKPLALAFDLPSGSDLWRQAGPVIVEIAAGETKLSFEREIEISRNFGLKQTLALTPHAPAGKEASPGVRLKADADANALYLIYEISGFNLEDAGADRNAFEYELRLDARSYGIRLAFGAVDALQLGGRAADGLYPFENPPPWVFGTGYAATYDPQYIRGQLSSAGSGARRFTVTLPRSYLYLHEWAIGNGNSQIGIRTDFAFWKGPREGAQQGDFPGELSFSLVLNGRHPDDAEGMAVLELTDKPTARWTVNPY